MTTVRSENDWRDHLAKLRQIAPETPLEDVARAVHDAGFTLHADRRGGFAAVPSACHPTIQRIRAAIMSGGRSA